MADADKGVSVSIEVFPERAMAGLRQVMTPNGPVSNLIQAKTQQVVQIAAGLIGMRYTGHHPERGKHLRESGSVEKGTPDGPDWKATFRHPIARMHRDGAKPHVYRARRIGQKPYFRSGPGSYFFGPVWHGFVHPGFIGNPYLAKAAQQAGLQLSGALIRGQDPRGFDQMDEIARTITSTLKADVSGRFA